jgi:zinc transport system substrate-binding protein
MRRLYFAISAFLLTTSATLADVKVVASIKPVHSLVAAVMKDIGSPVLLVDGANSPHSYSLKPSDARALSEANVIFWVGDSLEAFLKKPIAALGNKAKVVSVIESQGVTELALREGNGFEADEHADDDHAHNEHDAHIWLDPENAKAIVLNVVATLSIADAENATIYAANGEKTLDQLDALTSEISSTLQGNKNTFIVFHDAYQYFEKRFDIAAAGAITIHPENPPGAKAIQDIRNRLTDESIACVYAEPQFDAKLINVIIEGTPTKTGTLDPLGANLDPGPDLYFTLLKNLAKGIARC